MMAGLLLARAGIDVVVLEKYPDFFRDFRGDTIHPSTLEVMQQLGMLDEFLKLPHQKVDHLVGMIGADRLRIADFARLPVSAPYIAMMPQWDFLDFIASHARAYPQFRLEMNASADTLIEDGGKVVGVRATTPNGPLDIRALLTIGADGRHSTIRDRAGFTVRDLGAPMDVFWFRLSRAAIDTDDSIGHFDRGGILVAINRGTYWQCAYVFPKGASESIHAAGLEAFRAKTGSLLPFGTPDRTAEIKSWDDVKLLTVAVDRLDTWHKPGLLMIGDAAHAMSPIGGVGINLAVQDAVAAARMLAGPLRAQTVTEADLTAVQARRMWPAQVTQRLQVFAQNKVVTRALAGDKPMRAPAMLKLLATTGWFRGLLGRLVGMGVRPERVG